MKTNAIVRVIIWSIVIVLLVSLMGSVILGTSLFPRIGVTEVPQLPDGESGGSGGSLMSNPQGSSAVSAADIQKISIEWVAGSIRIVATEGIEDIRFSEDYSSDSRYQMVYKLSHDELKIKFCQEPMKFSGININVDLSKDLYIEVPAGWVCEELDIDAAAADLTVQDLLVKDVDFDGASGSCDFRNCTVGSLDMDTASGDVVFAGSLDTLDFDAASANFTSVFTNTPDRLEMDGMSGDLDITLPEDGGYRATMSGMSSSFHAEDHTPQGYQNAYEYGNKHCKINLDGMSCHLIIRLSSATETTAP